MANEETTETPEGLDLNALVLEMEALLPQILPSQLTFAVQLEPSLPLIKLPFCNQKQDSIQQLKQVIQALVQNSIEAMPNGGRLLIETMNTRLSEADAVRLMTQAGPCVTLSVTDTGCGMDERTRISCFEPFSSTKGRIGVGGLPLSYGILKSAFGGSIEANSLPGSWAIFRIYLPSIDKSNL